MNNHDASSPLRAVLESIPMPLHRLTVLSKVADPFRKDTPANHRDAEWVAAGIIRGSKESRRT